MTRTELRLELLKIASIYYRDPAQVVANAKMYEQFMFESLDESAIEERVEDLKAKKPEGKKLASK